MCIICEEARKLMQDIRPGKAEGLADRIEKVMIDETNGEVVVAVSEYLANAALGSPEPTISMLIYKRVADILLNAAIEAQGEKISEAIKEKAKAQIH